MKPRRLGLVLLTLCGLAAAQPIHTQNARHGPESLDRAILYQIWMRSFTPEGTLKAAAARLPHIASLNANIVYLSPINLQSRVGGFSNPYRIKDYYAIDPEYGTEEDLRRFVESAHKLGLKVLMDIVFYHTAPDSVMMATPEFYMRKDGQIVLGNWRLPRPDFESPRLRRYLIDNLVKWVKVAGVDGFRCDVSYGVPVDFWEQARAALDQVNPDLILLAESEKPDEMLKAFDISYNFSHLSTVQRIFRDGEPASALRAGWEKTRARFPTGTRFLRGSDNHDQARAIAQFGQKGALAASVINATFDGLPFLYNGQEIGDIVATDHQSKYPLRWELDMPEGQAGSGLARGQKAMADWYRRLFKMRLDEPALAKGELQWVETSQPESVVSFLRTAPGSTVLVLASVSNRKCSGTVTLPLNATAAEVIWKPEAPRSRRPDAEPQTGVSINGRSGKFVFGPFDYAVLRLNH